MKRLLLLATVAAIALGWCLPASHSFGQEDFEARLAADQEEGVELLARGPVHEAFAEPIVSNPVETLTISIQPPDPIDEVPPEYRPDGDNVVWIPGYWAWEDDREDFIWISGIWRNMPPGQRWVPGYWAEAGNGFQWVPGFWMTEEDEQIVYYPTPPESLEEGPTVEAPDEDHFWVPGVWTYETDWRWRPGYWAEYQPDWIWVPARWVWSPHGCVYLAGFWDYQPSVRGFLFAPVHFSQPVYQTVGYRYTPWYALRTPNLFVHLWVRPDYCHYYFGNYYHEHRHYGIQPWTTWARHHHHFDPILTHNRIRYGREGINYVQRIDRWHNYFVTNERYRPAVTVRQQINLVNTINIQDNDIINRINIGAPLRDLARSDSAAVRMSRVSERQRDLYADRASQIRDVYRARLQAERRDNRDRVAGAGARDFDRDRGATGRTRIPRVDVADLTGARDAATRARVPRQLDPGRPGADRARDMAERTRDTADRSREAVDRARDTADRARDRSREAAGDRTREMADRARDSATDRARDTARDRTRDLTDRTRDTIDDRIPAGAAERARDAATRSRDIADRTRDAALDRSRDAARSRDATVRDGAARAREAMGQRSDIARDRARTERPELDRSPTSDLGIGPDRPGRSGSLDSIRSGAERARLDLDRGPTPRSRPEAELRGGSAVRPGRDGDVLRGGASLSGANGGDMRGARLQPGSRSPTADLRDLDRARPAFGGSINDAPGSTIRSRTPSPYRGQNDRPGGLDGPGAAAVRREVLRPDAGGAAARGTSAGVGPGFDRSPATGRPSGRPAPTGLDLDRLRGADRAGGRDIPAMRPSGLGVGNSLNTPGVGGPGRGSAGPSRAADRPVSDGPGAGGPDDRSRGRGRR